MPVTLLTPQEVADKLHTSVRLIYKLVERGDLEGVKFGSGRRQSVRIVESSLEELIEAGRTNAPS